MKSTSIAHWINCKSSSIRSFVKFHKTYFTFVIVVFTLLFMGISFNGLLAKAIIASSLCLAVGVMDFLIQIHLFKRGRFSDQTLAPFVIRSMRPLSVNNLIRITLSYFLILFFVSVSIFIFYLIWKFDIK